MFRFQTGFDHHFAAKQGDIKNARSIPCRRKLSIAVRNALVMSKVSIVSMLAIGGLMAFPASAGVIGPDADVCASGTGSAILVRVEGLKDRVGPLRVRTFGGSPDTYFDKKRTLKRVELAPPSSGPVEVCMAVPGPGVYAVDIRHDANRNGDTDKSDGIGASGNPKISLFSIIFGKKPSADKVSVRVGSGVVPINIQVKYL
jgi:uncharacterized protein (DUF2141 family)